MQINLIWSAIIGLTGASPLVVDQSVLSSGSQTSNLEECQEGFEPYCCNALTHAPGENRIRCTGGISVI